MQYIKKILIVLLSVGLIVGCIPILAAESSESDSGASAAYEKLTALGMLSDETVYKGEESVSRGEFIRMIMEISGYKDGGVYEDRKIFADVTAETENVGYIYAAYDLGYICGDSDGRFYPDEAITRSQAIKITVCMLGYRSYAEANGDFPSGYILIADRLRLIGSLGRDFDGALTYDKAMLILEKAVEADLMEPVSIGTNTELRAVEGKNLMTERFNIKMMTAVVEADEYTDLQAYDSGLEAGEVVVGGMRFSVGKTDARDALGLLADIYYLEDRKNGLPEILYIDTSDSDNNILTLEADEIEGFDGKNTLKYCKDNDRISKAVLSDTASLIYNGKLAEVSAENLSPEIGSVVLISNDGDSLYDVVKVMSYRSVYVNGVSKMSSSVSGYMAKTDTEIESGKTAAVAAYDNVSLSLDSEASDYDTVILRDGVYTEFDAIKANQVISYAESYGKKPLKTVVISDKVLNGSVSLKKEDKLTIGGTEYRAIAAVCRTIGLDKENTFYLDFLGNIVYAANRIDIVYGYLTKTATGNFDEVKLHIFTQNNRWVNLKLADNVRFNGEDKINGGKILEKLKESGKGLYCQLIRYTVNDEGKIVSIDAAQEFESGSEQEQEAIEKNVFRLTSDSAKNYRNSAQSFDGDVTIPEGALIFSIPDDLNNESEFSVITRSDMVNDKKYTYKAYEGNHLRTVQVLTITNGNQSNNTNMMLVKNFGETLTSDGGTAPALFGYWKGVEISLPTELKNDSPIKNINELKKGDLISFSYNNSGNINSITRRYAYSASGENSFGITGNIYSTETYLCGTVRRADSAEKRVLICYSEAGASLALSFNNSSIYIYNSKDDEFSAGTLDDIKIGDQVFGRFRNLVCQELFVIR